MDPNTSRLTRGQAQGSQPAQAPPLQLIARNMPWQLGPQVLRPQSVEQVTSGLRSLTTGLGDQPIQSISNYFPISTYIDWRVYQNQVHFNPIQNRKNIQRGLLGAHKDLLGSFNFDESMLLSSKKYEPDINIPKHKLQLWPGYETTIRMYDSGILLRSEILSKNIREKTVLDFLKECANNKNKNTDWMMKFKMGVIGSIIKTTYNNQTYRIDDIDEDSNTQSIFCLKDGSRMSYVDYYQQKYGINFSNQYQPMLISKKKNSFIIEGNESKLVYLVPELCTLTGITDAIRENRFLMADSIEHTRIYPSERIDKCYNFMNRILTTPKSAESLTRWNLTLSNNLITIPGHVISQETLQGNNHKYPSGNDADWTVHLRKLPMFTTAVIQRWVIVTPKKYVSEVREFIKTLFQVARDLSFDLIPPYVVDIQDANIRTYLINLNRIMNEINPSFILCVIQSSCGDLYNLIKRQLCIDKSVSIQIVLLKQLQINNIQVCTKIAIQINCKLGGVPWRVVILEKNMMIIGFDVCYNKRDENKSYGALIATMNDTQTSFFSCVQQRESGEELSSYFAMSVANVLNKYKSINNTLPDSIIIYRDGVGDGQLSCVHRIEVDMIKKVCKEFYGEKKVGLAFIIIKKHISIRFFCKSYQNSSPGTVIDNTVTDPTLCDFYLVSQNVKKGTVTPIHYNVIEDSMKLLLPT